MIPGISYEYTLPPSLKIRDPQRTTEDENTKREGRKERKKEADSKKRSRKRMRIKWKRKAMKENKNVRQKVEKKIKLLWMSHTCRISLAVLPQWHLPVVWNWISCILLSWYMFPLFMLQVTCTWKKANEKRAHTCPLQNVCRPRTVEYPTTKVHLYCNRRQP